MLRRVVYSEQTVDVIAKIMNRHVPPYWDFERQKVFLLLCGRFVRQSFCSLKCLDTVHAMSDYQIHAICSQHESLKAHVLDSDLLVNSSGKIVTLLKLLAKTKQDGRRTIVFSQFTSFLDIVQEVIRFFLENGCLKS